MGLRTVPLTISSRDGIHSFTVELAVTREEQERGLMFRAEVAPDCGMLFPIAPPQIATLWMKNVAVALDILFIRRDGVISSICPGATPNGLEPLSSAEPVAAVLEIAGGRASALGIAAGDRADWPR